MSVLKTNSLGARSRVNYESIPEPVYVFDRFDNFVKDPLYLFLRTLGEEGFYSYYNNLSPFENMVEATIDFVSKVVTKEKIHRLASMSDTHEAQIVPVHGFRFVRQTNSAIEFKTTGKSSNLLSILSSLKIAHELQLPVDFRFQHSSKVTRNASSPLHRLAFPVEFNGVVKKGQKYLVFDDHIYSGGTVLALVGHLIREGGNVVKISTLATNPLFRMLRLRSGTLTKLRATKSLGCIEESWTAMFGYDFSCLSEVEAQILLLEYSKEEDNIINSINFYKDKPTPAMYPGGKYWPQLVEGLSVNSLRKLGIRAELVISA